MRGRMGRAPVAKPDDFRLAWAKLVSYMGGYAYMLAAAVVLSFLGAALTIIGPDVISDMTDSIRDSLYGGSVDMDRVVHLGIILVMIYAMGWASAFISGYLIAGISQKTAGRMRTDISEKMNRLPLRYFDSNTTGDVLSRISNDADTIGFSTGQSVSMMISSATLMIGSLAMMLYTDFRMAGAAVASSVAGFALVIIIMGRSQKHFRMQQENLGAMNGHVEEMYSAHTVVKAYCGEGSAKREFDAINRRLFGSAFKSQFLGGLMPTLMTFIGNLGYVAVCVAGSVLVLDGSVTIGTVVAFMMYVRLFTQPMSQISQAVMNMQSVAAASERVFSFLEEEEMGEEPGKHPVLKDVEGRVEFRDVHFGYSDGREVVRGFSASVEPGWKVAIVGPTGAGKTTIVNLLMRFYDADGGSILVDGVPISEMRREDVHDLFSMVLQDAWMFEGTVRENVAYCTDASDGEMVEACMAVGIHNHIASLPDGYGTVVRGDGMFSAGQRQQVTIARAMLDSAPMLILDEATSSVDTRTEKIIQEAMDSLSEKRTSFVIAHRLSTVRNADLILVMRDGSIIEKGTHETLLEKGGFYAELYNSQFEGCD